MKARLSTLAALLVAGGAAAAIAAAPAALAQPNCSTTSSGAGGRTEVCQSPGHAQISSTPGVYAQPWYGGGFFPWERYGPYIF